MENTTTNEKVSNTGTAVPSAKHGESPLTHWSGWRAHARPDNSEWCVRNAGGSLIAEQLIDVDARLIAAAPELLDMLSRATNLLADHGDPSDAGAIGCFRAVIAQAGGAL